MNFDELTNKKRRLDGFRPLSDTLDRNLYEWFRIDFTYSSNAIEGNTLNRQETAMIVEKGITVGGKSLIEHLEAVNHAKALDWVNEQINRTPDDLTENDILRIHRIILKGIDEANAGAYRSEPVRILNSPVIVPNPLKVPDLMLEFAEWLAIDHGLHPVERAAEAHYRLVTIHPFVDGNGRTARLLMNMILLMYGYPMAVIRKLDRISYINSLEKAQLGGTMDDFLKIVSKAVNRSLNIYLKAAAGEDAEPEESDEPLKIGQLARQSGVSNSTIRYWTKEGLLNVADITQAGYQLYAQGMVERIKQIQALKKQRLSLQEIKEQLD